MYCTLASPRNIVTFCHPTICIHIDLTELKTMKVIKISAAVTGPWALCRQGIAEWMEPVEARQGVTLIRSLDFTGNLTLASLRLWQALRRADPQIYVREFCSAVPMVVALFCRCFGRRLVYRTAGERKWKKVC